MKRLLLILSLLFAIALGALLAPFVQNSVTLAQTNTFCAANLSCTITGAWSFSSFTASLAVFGNINNVRQIDGTKFAKTAAGINAADTDCVAGTACVIEVTYPGTYSDAVITLTKNHILRFRSSGSFVVAGIVGPDSLTDTTGVWGVQCPERATLQLASASNRAIITHTNFLALTGTASQFGTFGFNLRGCTLDGNRANQTALATRGTGTILNVARTAGGLVTINFSNTPSPAYLAGDTAVIFGVPTDNFSFNGRFKVQSASATQITYNQTQFMNTVGQTTQPTSCSITAISESGNIVTATCTNTFTVGQFVVIAGVTVGGYNTNAANPNYVRVETASGANFTYVLGTTGLAGSSGGTATPTITAVGYSGPDCFDIFGRNNRIEDMTTANCVLDGMWHEGYQVTPVSLTGLTESVIRSTRHTSNGGNGITFWGPQNTAMYDTASWGNGHWGREIFQAVMDENSIGYNNGVNSAGTCTGGPYGSLHIQGQGQVRGANEEETHQCNPGWGILVDNNTQPNQLSSAQIACGAGSAATPACIGLELRTQNQMVQGLIQVAGTGTGGVGIKINGGTGIISAIMNQVAGGGVGTLVDCSNIGGGALTLILSGTDQVDTLRGPNCWTGGENLWIGQVGSVAADRNIIQQPASGAFRTTGGTCAATPAGFYSLCADGGTARWFMSPINGGTPNVPIVGTTTTDTMSNKTLTAPTVTGLTNGTGLQVFNTTTTCTTATTINTPCTTAAITLPVGYADTAYRISCVGIAAVTGFPQLQTITKSNTTFTITLNNLTAAAASYSSFDCVTGHN